VAAVGVEDFVFVRDEVRSRKEVPKRRLFDHVVIVIEVGCGDVVRKEGRCDGRMAELS
jgi:hypothetical protein